MDEPVPYEKAENYSFIDENPLAEKSSLEYLRSIVEKEGVLLDDNYHCSKYNINSKLYFIPSSGKIIVNLSSQCYFFGES